MAHFNVNNKKLSRGIGGSAVSGFEHGSLVSIKYLRTRVLVICSETERSNHTWVCLLGLPSTTAGIYSFVQWPQLVRDVLFLSGVQALLLGGQMI